MRRRLKKYFLTGLFVTLPLFISGYVLFVIFRFIDGILGRLINIYFMRSFGIYIPGLGFILFFFGIIGVGFVSTHLFGRGIQRLADRIGGRFPLIRHIYPSVKQIFEMLFPSDKVSQRIIVIFEYPRQGIWSIGFVVGENFKEIKEKTGHDLLNVYVPAVPNPATGFFVFIPRKDVIRLNISMKDAIRLIVSGGLLNPPEPPEDAKQTA
ncbi:MAG: DUF502 domain-containing protein [Candidatus Omnitrophota bacterium]|jgi:uncharacterized membrane protein